MLRFAVGIRYHERAVGIVQRRDAAPQDRQIVHARPAVDEHRRLSERSLELMPKNSEAIS